MASAVVSILLSLKMIMSEMFSLGYVFGMIFLMQGFSLCCCNTFICNHPHLSTTLYILLCKCNLY